MKYWFLAIFFGSFLTNAYSQKLASGVLLDDSNLEPVPNALLISLPDSNSTLSDQYGKFELVVQDSLIIQVLGYVAQRMAVGIQDPTIRLVPSDYLLSEAVVLGNHRAQALLITTSAVSRIDKKDIQLSDHLDYGTVLNQAPGVFMHAGTLNTNRITIRGIGSRNLFGTAKIRAYYGNIPLTNGSGESSVENITLENLESIEVIRGPSGNQYGAGLGGTIILNPIDAPVGLTKVVLTGGVGSYGGLHNGFRAQRGGDKNKIYFAFDQDQNEGYRDNNIFERTNFNILASQQLGQKSNLEILYSQTNLKAQIPSSLNESNNLSNPEKAAFTWDQSNGFEDSKQYLVGLNLKTNFKYFDQQIAIFYKHFNETEIRPFNSIFNSNHSLGGRATWKNKNDSKKLNWLGGIEFHRDDRDWILYETEIEEPFSDFASKPGAAFSAYVENKIVLNTFIQAGYQINNAINLSAGLNVNQSKYFLEDDINPNPSALSDRSFPTIISPKFDLSYQPNELQHFSLNVSHGFSPPTLEETLLPDGLINSDIVPEEGWNSELGWKKVFKNKKGNLAFNIYHLTVKNLLVARRTALDEFIGVNAGKSRSIGLEHQGDYQIFSKNKIRLDLQWMLNLQQFKFVEFEDDGARYDGNFLPGLPQYRHRLALLLRLPLKINISLQQQTVGEMFLRDDNVLTQDSYNLLDVELQQIIPIAKWQIAWSLRLNNILNEKYASMLLINAGSFGGNAPRYYYPGRPTNYFGKLSVSRYF